MTRADKALVILLWLLGVTGLLALIAVFMPMSWMAATHCALGMGEMPTASVVEYLARSVSAFYAVFGALCLVLAADLDRYRPVVRFLGVAFALMSVVLFGVDLAAGMPLWWSAAEGPRGIVLGVLIFVLARPAHRIGGISGSGQGIMKEERMEKVSLAGKLALFTDHWKPKIVGELNGQQVKLVKFQGPFVWHHHDNEDELFLVVKGRFRMELRDRHVWLEEGELLIVPRGVEHRPVAKEEAHVLLFEPASTLNTGNVKNERTVASLDRI
jgi:mannose-6-phosphate isomerase-like protein (cupin superfamily)